MKRPDLDTLMCVNPARQHFRRYGEAKLTVRKVYSHDRVRPLSCCTYGEEGFKHRVGHCRPPRMVTGSSNPSSLGYEVPLHGV